MVNLTSSSKLHAYKQSHKIGNVHTQLNRAHKELVEKNRKYVSIIIDILKYITRQRIALRGHDESKNSNNQGRHFIKMCNIQNEILNIQASVVKEIIVKNLKDCGMFAIMCDEARFVVTNFAVLKLIKLVFNIIICQQVIQARTDVPMY